MPSERGGGVTAWDAVVHAMRAESIPYVFGLPGDPSHLYDAVYELEQDGGPRAIGVRYETSGAFMAMAYARVTGQMAACFGCPGPGIANLVPGILEAYSGCTPMLILGVRSSRQTYGKGAFQETDHIGMLRPITKWAVTVEHESRIPWTIRRAVHLARSGQPGPVYVELPADIGLGSAPDEPYAPAPFVERPAPHPDAIDAAVRLLRESSRPLLILGGGAYLAQCGDAVEALASTFGIPVQTTPAGRSTISEDFDLFCGLVGLYRTQIPKEIYEGADLIITVGARMEEFQGGFLPLPRDPRIIQIEIEPFEIGRNWRPDVAIHADADLALRALHAAMTAATVPAFDTYAAEVRSRRRAAIEAARADVQASLAQQGLPMHGKAVVATIDEVFGPGTILCKENGGQDLWAYYWPYFQVHDRNACVPPAEQTAMGYGVIGAMAVKLAHPDRKVVCTTGDGAFQMSCHELGTAVQNRLGVTWVVLDDGAFGWVQWIQRRALEGRIVATDFDPPIDIAATAEAAGCHAVRVGSPDELRPALEQAIAVNQDGVPAVVVVPVDQAHHHAEFDRFHGYEPAADSATV